MGNDAKKDKPHPLGEGWLTKIVVAIIGIVAVLVGGTYVYTEVIVGSPDENVIRTQVAIEATQTALAIQQTPVSIGVTTVPIIVTPSTSEQTGNIQTTSELLSKITVLGSGNVGLLYTMPETGIYTFHYAGGAYCVWPNPATAPQDSCLPTIVVFKEGTNLWQSDGRTINVNEALVRVGAISGCGNLSGYCDSIDGAVSQGMQVGDVRARLQEGETIVFIAVDHREAYSDNAGQVQIEIFLERE